MKNQKGARLLIGHDFLDSRVQQYQKPPGTDVDIWKEMLDGSKNFPNAESPPQFGGHETCKISYMKIFGLLLSI